MPLREYSFDGIVTSVRAPLCWAPSIRCPIGRYWVRWEGPVPAPFKSSFGDKELGFNNGATGEPDSKRCTLLATPPQ